MATNFQIIDLVFQNQDLVIYRARNSEGTLLDLIRLRYDDALLTLLKGTRFDQALATLKNLNHNCLRPVLDGGQDPIDHQPWIAVQHWDGLPLSERIQQGPLLTSAEFQRIKYHASHLSNGLGPLAPALNLAPSSIVTSHSQPGELVDTFCIDYHRWFHAFAQDIQPDARASPDHKLTAFLTFLKQNSAPSPSSSTPLSSQNSPFPLKPLLFISSLLVTIAGCLWLIIHKEQKTPSITPPNTAKASSLEKAPPPNSPILEKKPQKKISQLTRPARPRFDSGHLKIQASDSPSLQEHTHKWVQLSGTISALNPDGRLAFQDSSLLVSLPSDSEITAQNALDKAVTIQGFLTSPTLLDVLSLDDIRISYSRKERYLVSDEAQLREMKGETIELQAKALTFTTSKSKATLYLLLHNRQPQFTISFQKSKLEDGIDEAFILSLIGKKITYHGKLKIENRGQRLSIVITKKSQITTLE